MNTEKSIIELERERVHAILTEGTYEEKMTHFYEFLSKQVKTVDFFGTKRFSFRDITLILLGKKADSIPNELDREEEIEQLRHRAQAFEEHVFVDGEEYIGLVTFLDVCHLFVSDHHQTNRRDFELFVHEMKRKEQQSFVEENQFAYIMEGDENKAEEDQFAYIQENAKE